MNMDLTESQKRVYDYIVSYIESNGYSPTLLDIQKGLGFNSPNAAASHVKALDKKGFIKTSPRIARSIVVLK